LPDQWGRGGWGSGDSKGAIGKEGNSLVEKGGRKRVYVSNARERGKEKALSRAQVTKREINEYMEMWIKGKRYERGGRM
jgi:hypothetical protein